MESQDTPNNMLSVEMKPQVLPFPPVPFINVYKG